MPSHPSIRFERVPIIRGTIFDLETFRPDLINRVAGRSFGELSDQSIDLLLEETLYGESLRLRHARPNWFTKGRHKRDQALWDGVRRDVLSAQGQGQASLEQSLQKICAHYADEIGGHFDPRVYTLATHLVPWGFSWLLNAASVKRFLPWGFSASLQSRLNIVGEIPLVQKLSQKGTVLMVPTHQSNIDSILVAYVIYLMSLPPFAFGAGLNLFQNPALSFFMSRLGSYTVDRSKTGAVYKRVLKNYSVDILQQGMHSVFFPGGGRSRSGALEKKVKLGLLGTGLQAEFENLKAGKENPRVFVVPMVLSFHFILEAASLIEAHLADFGKHRYVWVDDDFSRPGKVFRFFWRLFSQESSVTARIGQPMDVFGNPVDENGRSIGANGREFDPRQAFEIGGELRADEVRDREYTRQLGQKIVEGYHRGNTVLTSHGVAFALYESLRQRHRDLEFFRFLRIPRSQRTLAYVEFLAEAGRWRQRIREKADRGELFVDPSWTRGSDEEWLKDGMRHLGILHDAAVAKAANGQIWTEDMNLLLYYRNRLTGYGLSEFEKSEA